MTLENIPILRTLVALARELRRALAVSADVSSLVRLAGDLMLFRFLRLGGFGLLNRERTIRLKGGVVITYRANRGDIQSIREVWLEDIYLLPGKPVFPNMIDLGANIGQASLYFAKRYGVASVAAVEPNPQNALLARRNLKQNNVRGTVVEAAIGPADGVAFFADAVDSNSGHLSHQGREVVMISVPTLCRREQINSISIMKIDIEGGEQALLTQSTEWLGAVETIVAEFHPDCVDYPGLVSLVCESGFQRTTPSTFPADATEMFTRVR